jgi:hypothetical protein
MVAMARLFDFMKYDKDERGADVDEGTRLELRRLANLFLISALTLIALFLEVFAKALHVTFIPAAGYSVIGLIFLVGWAATLVYAVFVTYTARRWAWMALCLFPPTSPPVAIAYAWIRRQEIERAILGDPRAPAARQRRGGKKKR